MKVYLATDHAGFELKEKVKEFLTGEGYEVEDCGAYEFDKDDDYPDFISKAAKAVSKNPEHTRAIIFGGSGQAEMMVANKYKGVRAALFYNPAAPVGASDVTGRVSIDPYEMIRLTREHNNSNVLSLGVRFLTEDQARQAVKAWLSEPFPNHERHARRIDKIKKIEESL
ncbi:MAG: RpiB/LacA/LacB family sugar-phosphate isomerase [Candidatus Daviesbacteria bacterium]|nr:RpiB/LacA/LacB family sugar-phosphate isomerase [Candidatus Daviesbacteria bacterium]